VTYRTLGLTRRAEIHLPWTFGWTSEPQNWPQISRRDGLTEEAH
jgi:hypothetical protein